jgi:uncharacterized membrane protein
MMKTAASVTCALMAMAGLASGVLAQTPTITYVVPPVPTSFLFLDAMSADGSLLVGQSPTTSIPDGTGIVYGRIAQSFTIVGGQVDSTSDFRGYMYNISANGQWAVGQAGANRPPAFLTRPGLIYNVQTGAKIELRDSNDTSLKIARARGVNNAGTRAVGAASPNAGANQAVRWDIDQGAGTASFPVLIAMPTIPGATVTTSEGLDLSSDGTVAVGSLGRNIGGVAAWVADPFPGAAVLLPDVAGGTDVTTVESLNDSGTIAVGSVNATVGDFTGTAGAIWRKVGGVWTATAIAPLDGGTSLFFRATSEDGSRVFGESVSPSGSTAVVWSPMAGLQRLQDLFTSAGGTLDAGDFLASVEACSADGTILTGRGTLAVVGANIFTMTLPAADPCPNLSDVAGPNQSTTPDNQLTADDIIVFLGWYFASDTRADVAGANQSPTPDGEFTADDIIVFLGRYFAGC